MKNLYTKDDTIFVQIASYRDPELQHTLQDLFKKAKRPENIFIGIGHDYDMSSPEEKESIFKVPFPRPDQIKIDEIDSKYSVGPNSAKRRAQNLWNNEKWTLQIDSHMRFKENWDETIVSDIKKIGNKGEKIVLSNIPLGYSLETGEFDTKQEHNYGIKPFFYNRTWLGPIYSDNLIRQPQPSAILYGCFYFGDSGIIQTVKINPDLMHHDESNSSIRYFTSGGMVYVYDKLLIFHFWPQQDPNHVVKTNAGAGKSNPFSNEFSEHFLNAKKSIDARVLATMSEYGLGKERTLRDYERFSGLDCRRSKIRHKAFYGAFEEWQEVAKIVEVKNSFKKLKS